MFSGKPGGVVDVSNQGDITVTGIGSGIAALSKYYGPGAEDGSVSIQNEGNIAINASSYGTGGFGILGEAIGTVAITNTGNISLGLGDVEGPITQRSSQVGIAAVSSFGDATVQNSGDINVVRASYGSSNKYAAGIFAAAGPGDVKVVNSGNVSVSADPYDGVQVIGIGGSAPLPQNRSTPFSTPFAGGDVSVISTGDVTVNGSYSYFAYYGRLNLGYASAGVLAVAQAGYDLVGGNADVTIDNSAVTTTGDGVFGILASGKENTVSLTNGATVRTTGKYSFGIVVGSQQIENYSGNDLNAEAHALAPVPYGQVISSTNLVTVNAGTSVVSEQSTAIIDFETFAGKPPAFNGFEAAAIGFVVPNNTTVEAFGTITGGGGTAIALYGGDDAVIVGPDAKITGLVDGGEGAETEGDLLALGGKGTGNFDFSQVGEDDGTHQYVNFERYQKQDTSTFYTTGTNDEILSLPVLDGTLFVNGSLANADLPISGGATLGGTGTVGSFTALSGSTVAPGVPGTIGTFQTTGDATFESSSTFQVVIGNGDQNSRLNVGGTTTINGGIINVTVDPTQVSLAQLYTVIDSPDGVNGTFDGVTDNLPDIDFTDIYPGDQVQLGFIADAKNLSHKENGPAALFGAGFASINFAETLGRRAGLTVGAGSGETSSDPLAFAVASTDRNAAIKAVDDSMPAAVYGDTGPAVWMSGFGDMTRVSPTDDAFGYNTRTGGIAGGAEYRTQGEGWNSIVGVAGGYSITNVSVIDGGATVDSGHIGVYGAYNNGPMVVSGALAYSRSAYDLFRSIDYGTGSATATGEASGNAFSGFGEISYDVANAMGSTNVSFGPVARFRGVSASRSAYTEAGAGIFNLDVSADSVDQYFAAIGIKGSTKVTFSGVVLKPEFELLYERNLNNKALTSDSVLVATGTPFSTPVSGGGADRVSLGLGLGAEISPNVDAHARFDTSFGSGVRSTRASVGFSVKF